MSDMPEELYSNLGLDLARSTEAAARVAGRWMGLNKPVKADRAASQAMADALNSVEIDGVIVVGEEEKTGFSSPLCTRSKVGTGAGPALDLVLDPIDGRNLLAKGLSDAIAVAGAAPRGAMWSPKPAVYMEKIVVDKHVAASLVPECMEAPAAWTLALVARAMEKSVRDLVVFVLDRPRHRDLIDEIRTAGARVVTRSQGDIAGALLAASDQTSVDLLMGVGGVSEGVIAACAIKSLGGAMLARLAPQSEAESKAITGAGMSTERILTCEELVAGEKVFFAATGITSGALLSGVRYRGNKAQTESLVLRGETGTWRKIQAEHLLED